MPCNPPPCWLKQRALPSVTGPCLAPHAGQECPEYRAPRPLNRPLLARCAVAWSLTVGLFAPRCRGRFRHGQQGTIQTPRSPAPHLMHHRVALADHATEKRLQFLVPRPLLRRFLDALREILRRKGASRRRREAFLQHLLARTLRRSRREDRLRSQNHRRSRHRSRGRGDTPELMFLQQRPHLAHHFEVRQKLGLQFRQSIGSEVRRSHGEKDVHFGRNGKWKAIQPLDSESALAEPGTDMKSQSAKPRDLRWFAPFVGEARPKHECDFSTWKATSGRVK